MATSITKSLSPGSAYGLFRVLAIDGAGNYSEWTYGSEFVLDAHQETSSAISYGGTWTTEASSSATEGI